MRTMYDAVTAANIPRDAQMVAGYIDRIVLAPWTAADWARFPNAIHVTIVKKPTTNDGHVLDVEPGDATPAQAPGWVRMRRDSGADPTVYCDLATWGSVRAAFRNQGVAEPHYWIAHYDGDPSWSAGWAESGVVAKQFRGNVPPGVDISSVADHWPGVDSNGGELVATSQEIDAIAQATVSALMSRTVGTGEPETKTQLPFSTMVRYTQFDASKINGVLTRLDALGAKVAGATAEEIAAALLPGLAAAVAAELAQEPGINDEDAQRIAQAVTDRTAALLGASAPPAAGQ